MPDACRGRPPMPAGQAGVYSNYQSKQSTTNVGKCCCRPMILACRWFVLASYIFAIRDCNALMAYVSAHFVVQATKENHVVEQCICAICTGLLWKPLITPCEHAFCGACIRAVPNLSRCPSCRAPVTLNDLKALPRMLINILNAVDVNCVHSDSGCKWFVRSVGFVLVCLSFLSFSQSFTFFFISY